MAINVKTMSEKCSFVFIAGQYLSDKSLRLAVFNHFYRLCSFSVDDKSIDTSIII